jgi:serine phosphatase RsbU (regulator of sigma subunit)
MLKLKNIKLNTVFITGLVLILGSSMVFLAFAAVESIISLGAYTTHKVEEEITKQASELFFTRTVNKAKAASSIFNDAHELAKLYGEQVAFIYDNIDKFTVNQNELEKYKDKFLPYKKGSTLVYLNDQKIYNLYAGGKKKLSDKEAKLLYTLSSLNPLLMDITNSSKLYLDTWLYMYIEPAVIAYGYHGLKQIFLASADEQRKAIYGNSLFDDKHPKLKITAPYTAYGMGYYVTTHSNHYARDGKLVFSTGIDIKLNAITKNLLNQKVSFAKNQKSDNSIYKTFQNNRTFSFIILKNGKVISFPNDKKATFGLMKNETKRIKKKKRSLSVMFFNNISFAESKYLAVKNFLKKVASSVSDTVLLKLKKTTYMIAFSRMEINDWVLCTAVPVDLLLEPVNKTRAMMKSTISGFKMNFMFLSGFFLLISILLIVIFFRKYLIIPIVKFRNRAVKMGEGNFGASVLLEGTSEIKELGLSFNSLGGELRTHMINIEKEILKNAKIENEVKVARQIQQAILPRITDGYKNIGIDLFAELHPAKDVAGDFYDFFFLSDNKMAIVIADVSGKGIAASFFMSIAKRVLKNVSLNEPDDPAEALKITNEILTSYNVSMFVTIFLAYYELDTGRMEYANAGHNEALLLNASGACEYFGSFSDTVSGFVPDLEYHTGEIIINPGDTLVLYTDGVTEANKPSEEEYGEERLKEFIIENKNKEVKDLLQDLIDDVHKFEEGGQFDDITVVIFRRK